jgi:hypothetical protein
MRQTVPSQLPQDRPATIAVAIHDDQLAARPQLEPQVAVPDQEANVELFGLGRHAENELAQTRVTFRIRTGELGGAAAVEAAGAEPGLSCALREPEQIAVIVAVEAFGERQRTHVSFCRSRGRDTHAAGEHTSERQCPPPLFRPGNDAASAIIQMSH